MPLLTFSAVRDSAQQDKVLLTWTYEGTDPEQFDIGWQAWNGDERSAIIYLNIWLEHNITLSAFDLDAGQLIPNSQLSTIVPVGVLPELIAPTNLSVQRTASAINVSFTPPAYVATFPYTPPEMNV